MRWVFRRMAAISAGDILRPISPNRQGPLEHRFDLTQLTHLPGGIADASPVQAVERLGTLSLALEQGGPYRHNARLHVQDGARRLSTIERGHTDGYRHSAYTLTPDGQSILSGGLNGVLRLYALDGTLRGTLVGHTGEIKAVAVSADGRWALSGANDQTLCLWSLPPVMPESPELKPTLTLFPAQDGEWVAWTPEAYFTASGRGMRLIGASINQGLDKVAPYISGEQLRERFYRPELIQTRLHGEPRTSPPNTVRPPHRLMRLCRPAIHRLWRAVEHERQPLASGILAHGRHARLVWCAYLFCESLTMFIKLDGSGALSQQIYHALRRAILAGQLAPGHAYQPRASWHELGVSRNTVLLAYDQLLAEGYTVGQTGSGTYVASALPDVTLPPDARVRAVSASEGTTLHLSAYGRRVAQNTSLPPPSAVPHCQPVHYDFRYGLPDGAAFPHETWRRLLARWARAVSVQDLHYGPPEGYAPLRQAIADYLQRARAVVCEPEQIIVVNGSQQALDLTARVLLDAEIGS